MAAEQFANLAATTLSSGVDNAVTTLPVTSGAAPFPQAAQFRVVVDNEIMLVTGGAGTSSWTVTRGAEGTSAVAHLAGAAVTHVLTAGALLNLVDTASPVGEAPADVGLLEWNIPLYLPNASADLVKGFIWVASFNVRRSRSVTNFLVRIGTAGVSLSNCYITAFDSTGTRVGGTPVDQSTSWQSAGPKTVAIPSGPVTMPAGAYYMAGLVGNGSTTACNFLVFNTVGIAPVNDYRTFANAKIAVVSVANNGSASTAQTAMPASITIGSNGIVGLTGYTNTIPWVGIS